MSSSARTVEADAAAAESRSATLRFLTFRVGEELYALDAGSVAEIVRVPPFARVPQSTPALLGVANLRGEIMPMASVRGLLGLERIAITDAARAIVLRIGAPIALVVDAVGSLVVAEGDRIEARPVKLAARGGEKVLGGFRIGSDGPVAKILDVEGLLEHAFARRAAPRRQSGPRTFDAAHRDFERKSQAAAPENASMLLTFDVAGQEFALELGVVQEILPAPAAFTALPRSETLVLGMTSHRGGLLPLLSLRGLLGFPVAAPANGIHPKVVVTRVGGANVGLVADRARAIVSAPSSHVDDLPPVLAARTGGEATIRAVYRADAGRRLISILAPERLFKEDVMERLGVEQRATPSAAGGSGDARSSEIRLLVFRLGDDEFGLPIECVDEVADVPARITRFPKTPAFLEGVVNLRGDVLPVVDQRRRFDMSAFEGTRGRRLIVVRTERHRAGLIVDSVSDVLRIRSELLSPAPELTNEIGRLVKGVVNLEQSNRIVLLLDPTELLTQGEEALLDAFKPEAPEVDA